MLSDEAFLICKPDCGAVNGPHKIHQESYRGTIRLAYLFLFWHKITKPINRDTESFSCKFITANLLTEMDRINLVLSTDIILRICFANYNSKLWPNFVFYVVGLILTRLLLLSFHSPSPFTRFRHLSQSLCILLFHWYVTKLSKVKAYCSLARFRNFFCIVICNSCCILVHSRFQSSINNRGAYQR